MRKLIAAQQRLTVYQLPPYAPKPNLGEGVWAHLKTTLANSPNTDSTSSPPW
nr:hypothetical protein [Streptomyces polyasparticus]